MQIRKAVKKDIDSIMSVYANARKFMSESGNSAQWGNGYPTRELIEQDISQGDFYICENQGKISAVFCFFVGIEPSYKKIFDGKWLNNEKCGIIHRIAVIEHKKGIASFCIQWCISQWHNIKIDTYKDNLPMQHTILKNGFTYCGIIKKDDGTTRLAYQIAD